MLESSCMLQLSELPMSELAACVEAATAEEYGDLMSSMHVSDRPEGAWVNFDTDVRNAAANAVCTLIPGSTWMVTTEASTSTGCTT